MEARTSRDFLSWFEGVRRRTRAVAEAVPEDRPELASGKTAVLEYLDGMHAESVEVFASRLMRRRARRLHAPLQPRDLSAQPESKPPMKERP